MKRFFLWLLTPQVWSFLVLVLLSLILWFEGPLLAFDGYEPFASDNVRLIWIGVFFWLWVGYQLWRWIVARRINTGLMRDLSGEEQTPAPGTLETAAELATLGQRLHAAMKVLRKTRFGDKRGGLYQLPWYLFIGAPAAGKTTALEQSGLTFPLADSRGSAAIGGTRNCKWWFTDEAVLLDTAGRYATQDCHVEIDKAVWGGFLQLLCKHRRRRPLNGVILALSVADLLHQNDAARQVQAQAMRARIEELHQRLGIRFPIYVIVMKCDLLAGFVEFFDHLGREERAQVWGMTFPLTDAQQVGGALPAFPAEFGLLEQQLQARVLSRVQQERDPQRRALMYCFPQQFSSIGGGLGQFLKQVFASNLYQETALLRGVYFSSGTQKGSPIDHTMAKMAPAFSLQRQILAPGTASGRSYFLTKLLREVIFREAELGGTNLALEKKQRYLHWGAALAVACVFVLLSAALATSDYRNRHYVQDVKGQIADINQRSAVLLVQGDVLPMLLVLDQLRNLPGGYAQRDQGSPWLMRFGLNQRDKIGEVAELVYQKILRQTLLPQILENMEQQLRRDSANSNDYLYETLRVYLMLGDARHFNPTSVKVWLDVYWARNLKQASEAQKQALSSHLDALLEQFIQGSEVPKLNLALIDATRLTLARMPVQQQVYGHLKHELSQSKLPEFIVSNVGGRDAIQVLLRRSGEPLTRGINGMFSVAGYRKLLQQNAQAINDVANDGWVLARQEKVASRTAIEQIKAAVLQLYFNDYIKEWDALLADVATVPFSTLDQGVRISTMLAGPESPLRKFLQAAARETTLDVAANGPTSKRSVGTVVQDKFDSYKKKLERAIGSTADEVVAAPKILNPVDLHFDDLHKMVGAGAGAGAGAVSPLDSVLAMLKDVALYLDAAAMAKRSGAPAPAGDVLGKLKHAADDKPAPLASILQNIDASAAGLASGSDRERLNSLWSGSGGAFCRDAIAGRYPLLRSAEKEVTADDFGKFFSPGGLMDEFFQKNLVQYVDMGGKQWRWRNTAQNASLGMSQKVLADFQNAARIRDAFFSAGGRQPSLRFDLKPLSVDVGSGKLVLEIDGQKLIYLPNTAPHSMSFQLPSGKGSGLVLLEIIPGGKQWHTDGNWAWFHMIDKGSLEATSQGERYILSFDLDGKKAMFELTASSVINPFRRDMLEQFHCVDSL